MHPESGPASDEVCRNCGATLHGPFCAQCGQEDKDLDVTVRGLVTDAVTTALDLDSRVVQTARLLLIRPGALTSEYLAGRRARYVPPVRLYLFVSFLYFLVLAWTTAPTLNLVTGGAQLDELDPETRAVVDSTLAAVGASDPRAVLDSVIAEAGVPERPIAIAGEFITRARNAAEDPAAFWEGFFRSASYLMFFLVPLFGVMLRAAYRRRGFLVHHLVFSFYFHSFVFLFLLLRHLAGRAGVPDDPLNWVLLLVPIYFIVALLNVYRERWWKTLLKAGALMGVYGTLLGVGVLTLLITLVWLG